MKKYIIMVVAVVLLVGSTASATKKLVSLSEVKFSTEFDSTNFDNVVYERFVDSKYSTVCYSQMSRTYTPTTSDKAVSISCISTK